MKAYWRTNVKFTDEYGSYRGEAFGDAPPGIPVVTSLWEGKHYPTLDIDIPCDLYQSKTLGHQHLFIHRSMTWRQYRKLLKALAKAGVCEKEWVKVSLRRGFTFVRSRAES